MDIIFTIIKIISDTKYIKSIQGVLLANTSNYILILSGTKK